MKRLIHFIPVCILLFSSCDSYILTIKEETHYLKHSNEFLHSIEVRSDLPTCGSFEVSEKMAAHYVETIKGHLTIKSIEPYNYDGITCFYIINFDEGWMIVAADERILPIIADSDKDNLYFKETDNEGIKAWLASQAEIIASYKRSNVIGYDQDLVIMWENIKKIQSETVGKSLDPEGATWVKITLPPTTNISYYTEVDHLIETKWGQGSKWNCSLPTIPTNAPGDTSRFLTGCVPTAIAQLLYYSHNNTGYPNDLFHSLDPSLINQGNYYSIYLNKNYYTVNSPRWSSMPLTKNSSGNFYYASDLMLDIGSRMGAKYTSNSTSVTFINNSTQPTIVLNPCGISAYRTNYDSSSSTIALIRADLLNEKPLFIESLDNNNLEIANGHFWIIDGIGIRSITTTTNAVYYIYQPGVLYPPGAQFLSDSDVLPYYPYAYDGMAVIDSQVSTYSDYLLMNFGWNGNLDEGRYSANISTNPDWANN